MRHIVRTQLGLRWLANVHYSRATRLARLNHAASAHRYFAKAAQLGHVEALYQLGLNYSLGIGCTRSGSEALRWFEAAAEQDHPRAQFELGVALLADHDVIWCAGSSARWADSSAKPAAKVAELVFPGGLSSSRDDRQAYLWLRRSADAGTPAAQANLGWLLLQGIGCDRDRAEAHRLFTSAVAHDVSQAALGLAEFYGDKQAAEYNPWERRRWLERASDLGNSSAAFELGLSLLEDTQNEDHSAAAKRYLLIAAERKHAGAACKLGEILLAESSSAADVERAAEYLRSAAKSSHTGAAVALGELYSRGDKLKPDLREAFQWFRRAADAEHVHSQFQVGCLFARGEGVPQDLTHAARYFESSARAGHLVAALNIAIFYETGQGVQRSLDDALAWLKVAADGGVPQAQVRLARHLQSSSAEAVDLGYSMSLLERAANQNNAEAEVALAQLLYSRGEDALFARADALLTSAISKGYLAAIDIALSLVPPSKPRSVAVTAAIDCLEASVRSGYSWAKVILARELALGRHLTIDLSRVEALLLQASEAQDPNANFQLGVFYCRRNRVPDDLSRGLFYYMRAAELGHSLGQYNSALMLLNGAGADPDQDQAIDLLDRAAKQGVQQAQVLFARLTGREACERKSA